MMKKLIKEIKFWCLAGLCLIESSLHYLGVCSGDFWIVLLQDGVFIQWLTHKWESIKNSIDARIQKLKENSQRQK